MSNPLDALRAAWNFLALGFWPVVLVLVMWVGIAVAPKLSRVAAAANYRDFDSVREFQSVRVDRTVAAAAWRHRDVACWRVEGRDPVYAFGMVAALPGQSVAIADERLLVDGEVWTYHKAPINTPDRPAVIVPAGHIFVMSNGHRYDSFTMGVLPFAAIHGRAEGL